MKILLILLLLTVAVWADPPSHDIEVLHNEASAAVNKKDYATATMKAQKALDIAEKAYGKLDARNLLCLEKVYDIQVAAQDPKGAEVTRRKMLGVVQAVSGANSPEMANERQRMANFLAYQERWGECGQLYNQVIEFYRKDSSGRFRQEQISAIHNFVQILQAQHKDAEAAQWEQKAKQLEKDVMR